MAASQDHISGSTPMGANLIGDGATFRVWAPGAIRVYVAFDGGGQAPPPSDELVKDAATGHWTGFFPGVVDGTRYRFWVEGPGNAGLKRDPWARELEFGDFHDTDCIVRDRDSYPWHDDGFVPPALRDLVVYQFHVGVFYARSADGGDRRPGRVAKFLDALDRVEYLADLGVNAVQPLPFVEFRTPWSLGYNGTDIFSPEMDYCIGSEELPSYLEKVNGLLAKKGCAALTPAQLRGQVNQLKAFVDLCHLYGLAVLPDVVYNHAGGDLDDQSLDYFDRPANPDEVNSLYFSQGREAGGKVFDYQKPEVRELLIGNARMFLDEYHVDGFRFDQVTVIDDNQGGRRFCQDLTDTLRFHKPAAALIAEYWGQNRRLALSPPPEGMGFHLGYADLLREEVRAVLGEATGGEHAGVHLGQLRPGLERSENVVFAWQAYNCIENHDLLVDLDDRGHRQPRIAQLAHWDEPRSWYARSRARVATALLLTAPGVPMIFMGQEFLEDKQWSDNFEFHQALLLHWAGLDNGDKQMLDHVRFTRELVGLRWQYPALRGQGFRVVHIHDQNRVLAFHRWVEGEGHDVIVVVHLSTFNRFGYRIGFPSGGEWREIFSSDVYENWVNPHVAGNGGRVVAEPLPLHEFSYSAALVLPANSILVFSR